ncbi:MAG: hypothetical protein EBS00_07105, partial [Verrucomicrobia bacterium]|nr:hypothetical protein [Verrucomicrobiota bacterium]
CRFEGILELFHCIDIAPDGTITNNFGLKGKVDGSLILENSQNYKVLADKLRQSCFDFIPKI